MCESTDAIVVDSLPADTMFSMIISNTDDVKSSVFIVPGGNLFCFMAIMHFAQSTYVLLSGIRVNEGSFSAKRII